MKRLTVAILLQVWWIPTLAIAQQHGHHQHGAQCKHGNAKHDKHATKASSDSVTGKQITCPVMGGEIDEKVFIEYEGQKVYFCCPPCKKKFTDSPRTYLPALYKQWYPQRVQVKCPVMGGVVNPDVFVEHKGQQVHFCCKGCDTKFKADADKYMKKLPEISTSQVHCPITGKPINPKHSAEFGGKTVYFSDKDSAAEFQAKPKKYTDALRPEASLLAHGATAKDNLLLCPVCLPKGAVHKRSEVETIAYRGFSYAMCNSSCVEKFKAEPDKYTALLQQELMKRASGEDKAYTCSMHPQVIRNKPGKCPLCAMDLAPAVTTNAR
jgi:Cu+-exporting ATPase